jgi:hypothetical protein
MKFVTVVEYELYVIQLVVTYEHERRCRSVNSVVSALMDASQAPRCIKHKIDDFWTRWAQLSELLATEPEKLIPAYKSRIIIVIPKPLILGLKPPSSLKAPRTYKHRAETICTPGKNH